MHTSGFSHTPVSRILVFYIIASALLVSLTDNRQYIFILVDRHLWGYHQFWRLLTWQAAYLNSVEVICAVWTVYGLRVVERGWGSRKFMSFILTTLPYTTLLPPLLTALILRPLTLNSINLLPAGPTPLIFALLAQYHASVPATFRYRLLTRRPPSTSTSTSTQPSSSPPASLTLTSKSLSYIFPLQLALSQLPGSAIAAAVGFAVGYACRNEVLPGGSWRVPGWVVGEERSVERARFEGLRRRLELEREGDGRGTGRDGEADGDGDARRRTLGGLVAEQFRGGV
ncbi:hypothetical protein EJ05DRAFT_514496 [Pseudovirgaria hyperparasitica]|uniref:Peptidase S54 rhomboid domain-containing protein n=1 Tax=Pseudovirgaria hyperparasitica TaxID=470096 RepID=A0A6A6VTV7_9PEZI|nr:uncharacterized protein EJ05DRAFT_514496 [Pseudovirgaria hyperparasitica]KAF2754012.1 hypothetical protein EJ05DRAFT_514496 [Pseudovirgaria hyperparasitica]